jgi:Zn-dependent M28 family amino/carboxypeptidase
MRRYALTTAERLRAHVVRLAGEIGDRNVFRPDALEAAAEYIAGQWHGFGYRVDRQEYQANGVTCANLEVERPGREPTSGIMLIGAHYDSLRGCPAANDNGSGVAALLELARRFAEVEPGRTVRFVAFANEEPPFFMTHQQGSIVYARAAQQRGDDIRMMASLETMGYFSEATGSQRYPPLFRHFYPDRSNFLGLVSDFLGLVSDFRSRPAMSRLAAAFRAASDFPLEHTATFRWIPGVAWSDHRSFWRAGYRPVMITDTAFYRYPYYHTAADTPDKLAYDAFARATEGLYGAFAALAAEAGSLGSRRRPSRRFSRGGRHPG